MNTEDNNKSFLRRFYIYQKERFPIIGHGIMITAFTFSAISYSGLCRGVENFIPGQDFIIGIFATITLFLLVRIFDEFKDKEDDAKYRKYLPVPRGLISFKELKIIGLTIAIIQIAVIAIFQLEMLLLYSIVIGYLLLMGVEFFVPNWLKKRQIIYITSHMVIIPLIDIYSSGLDWLLAGASPHWGLAFFFVVSYLNGLSLEFGRKIRHPEGEEEGVVSYTGMYGTKGGTIIWMALMFVTMLAAMAASAYANFGITAYIVFAVFFIINMIPAVLFIKNHTKKLSKMIEYASVLWTILMYFALGGIPMLKMLLF